MEVKDASGGATLTRNPVKLRGRRSKHTRTLGSSPHQEAPAAKLNILTVSCFLISMLPCFTAVNIPTGVKASLGPFSRDGGLDRSAPIHHPPPPRFLGSRWQRGEGEGPAGGSRFSLCVGEPCRQRRLEEGRRIGVTQDRNAVCLCWFDLAPTSILPISLVVRLVVRPAGSDEAAASSQRLQDRLRLVHHLAVAAGKHGPVFSPG